MHILPMMPVITLSNQVVYVLNTCITFLLFLTVTENPECTVCHETFAIGTYKLKTGSMVFSISKAIGTGVRSLCSLRLEKLQQCALS